MRGAFLSDDWIATDATWADPWPESLSFAIRGKLAEWAVRDAYARVAAVGPQVVMASCRSIKSST